MANLSGLWKDENGKLYTILDGTKNDAEFKEIGRLMYMWNEEQSSIPEWKGPLHLTGVMRNRESVIFVRHIHSTEKGVSVECRFHIPGEMRKHMVGGSKYKEDNLYNTTPEDEYIKEITWIS